MNRKRIADAVVPLFDLAIVLWVIPAALLLKLVRRLGLARLRLSRAVLLRIGVLPIRNHYYEPFVGKGALTYPLDRERPLPGIDLNEQGQLDFLSSLTFEEELGGLTSARAAPLEFRLGNQSFESGDAEYLYQVIRRTKPARLFEIGSGHSTLIARAAIKKNCEDDRQYDCRHVCIEPYEAPWLERSGVEVLRQRVEELDASLFRELGGNDLLFIDSSHVIRPQGDVLAEYLNILPVLRSGVLVHIHDVFTPRDYPADWVTKSQLLWNEQYLLEAFLSGNDHWTVIGALNMLKHRHFEALRRACPYLTADREPGSMYIRRR